VNEFFIQRFDSVIRFAIPQRYIALINTDNSILPADRNGFPIRNTPIIGI
jgi:hypothetical protein